MSETSLLKPREVDYILRYPRGRTQRLAKAGLFPHIPLPDGEVRIERSVLDVILQNVQGVLPETIGAGGGCGHH